MKIPFSPPYHDEAVEAEVLDSLRSGWITTGPKVRSLEQETAKISELTHALCCNSATSAMMLVLHWFGVSRGDEVIVPAYTYCATALACLHLGATPVMVDCGTDFNLDISKVEDAITERTKVIIPVDIAGWPCDYDLLLQLLNSKKIRDIFVAKNVVQKALGRPLILSDAAHSLGAKLNGKPAAKFADFTVYSFHAVKNVTTAEGGAIVINWPIMSDHEQIYKTFKLWSLNGQTKDAFSKSQVGGWKYDIVYPGFKMNMPDILAAVGLAQLRIYVSELLVKRKAIIQNYNSYFKEMDWAILPPFDSDQKQTAAHLYLLRIKNCSEDQRDRIIEEISKYNVAVNVHFIPMPMLTVFKERGYDISKFPRAYEQYSNEISLPLYPQLTSDQQLYILNSVKNSVEKVLG
jgi:dTDP-4-amino-4,6-dideoxygalactose transaminase